LAGGQRLRTGWFSTSDLLAPDYGSRFHLGSRTRVRLASDTPGVLLELERGRLRALFDKLSGQEPVERRIETPSAILAVRGTEYGVAVNGSGDTTLVVFSGAVEVLDRGRRAAPVRVEPGYALHVRRGRAPGAPYPHAMSSRHWDRGAMPGNPGRMSPGAGAGPGGRGTPPAGQGQGGHSRGGGPGRGGG
jgi:ferric-dicitrate binding protein FerR (iron transport regulator)